MSAMELVTEMKVDSKTGSGPCPVCHQDRKTDGCRTWWSMELVNKQKWSGTLFVTCRADIPREEKAQGLNAFHQRGPKP